MIPLGATTILEPSVFTGGLSDLRLRSVVLGVVIARMRRETPYAFKFESNGPKNVQSKIRFLFEALKVVV